MCTCLSRRPSSARLAPGSPCESSRGTLSWSDRELTGAASGGNSFRALQMMGLGEDYAKVAGESGTRRDEEAS